MKMLRKISVVLLVALCVAAVPVYGKMDVQYSGFLGDYSQLQPGPKGGVKEVYMREGVDFTKYKKIMMDHVVFYFKNDAENKGIDVEEMKELAAKFHRAVIDALGEAYPLVAKPGPDVMRVRTAITDIDLPNRAINAISTIMPVGLAISTVKQGATGKGTGCGEISMEFEFLDSETNQRIAAGVDRKAGGKFDSMSKFGTAEDAFKFWAERLRKKLDEIHGKPEK